MKIDEQPSCDSWEACTARKLIKPNSFTQWILTEPFLPAIASAGYWGAGQSPAVLASWKPVNKSQ